MSEIVTLHVGGCGNEIGKRFWNEISTEHGVDKIGTYHGSQPEQFEKINVCYNEEPTGTFVPRCIFVDLGEGSLDYIRSGNHGNLFRNDNIITGGDPSWGNWARGHYINGPDVIDIVVDAFRKECEKCDCLQGVNLTHSLGGGTGSGMGSLLMEKIKEENPDKLVTSLSVFPSPKVSDCVVEAYNATLTMPYLLNDCDAVFCIDNESLFQICTRSHSTISNYKDLNRLISTTLTGVTSTLRFPTQLNSTLSKMCMNLVPFPDNHFFINGLAPLGFPMELPEANRSVSDVIHDAFDAKNMLVSCDPRKGRYLSALAIFKGWASKLLIDEQVIQNQSKNHKHYVEWLPDNLKTFVCNIGEQRKISATTVGNNSAISEMFRSLSERFTALFRRKAFWHSYTGEGVDEMEFTEADCALKDLISSYSSYDSFEHEDSHSGSDAEAEPEEAHLTLSKC